MGLVLIVAEALARATCMPNNPLERTSGALPRPPLMWNVGQTPMDRNLEVEPAWLTPLLHRIRKAAAAVSGEVVGCTLEEVAQLERRYGVVLPHDYKAVLLAIGRRADGFLDPNEFDFYYEQLLELTRSVREDSACEGLQDLYPTLPPTAFFVRGRYFEHFELILYTGQTDPPVHYFNVEDRVLVPAYPSIAVWLETLCNDELS